MRRLALAIDELLRHRQPVDTFAVVVGENRVWVFSATPPSDLAGLIDDLQSQLSTDIPLSVTEGDSALSDFVTACPQQPPDSRLVVK